MNLKMKPWKHEARTLISIGKNIFIHVYFLLQIGEMPCNDLLKSITLSQPVEATTGHHQSQPYIVQGWQTVVGQVKREDDGLKDKYCDVPPICLAMSASSNNVQLNVRTLARDIEQVDNEGETRKEHNKASFLQRIFTPFTRFNYRGIYS